MLKWLAIYLQGLTCTVPGQAAIIGQLQVESGLIADIDRGFVGLMQLGYERRERYLAWAGRHWRNPENQVRWMVMEMRLRGLWEGICHARDPKLASRLMDIYEGGAGSAMRLQSVIAVYRRLPRPAITFGCASC